LKEQLVALDSKVNEVAEFQLQPEEVIRGVREAVQLQKQQEAQNESSTQPIKRKKTE